MRSAGQREVEQEGRHSKEMNECSLHRQQGDESVELIG